MNPGSEANPLRPDNNARVDRYFDKYVDSDRAGGISIPRVLDDGTFFAGIQDQEAMFTMATVVNREGRITNAELLNSERSGAKAAQAVARQRRRGRPRCGPAVAIRAGADTHRPDRRRQHGVADCRDDGAADAGSTAAGASRPPSSREPSDCRRPIRSCPLPVGRQSCPAQRLTDGLTPVRLFPLERSRCC